MHLARLRLRDFRNWERLDLALESGLVVFHGPNGAGKTNLLEAVHLAAVGEPPRARTIEETIRHGCEHAYLAATFAGEGGGVRIEVGLSRRGERRLKVGGAPRRRADLIGLAPVVHFSTRDIEVVRGEPGGRRRLLDAEIGAIDRGYYFSLARYRRTLDQRNRLLKDLRPGAAAGALEPWDRSLARYGARVMVGRADFVAALAPQAAAAYARLSGEPGGVLALAYRPAIAVPEEHWRVGTEEERRRLVEEVAGSIEGALRERRKEDIAYGVTGQGPHRDDVELLLRGRPVRLYGSQGEQRACAAALRMGLAAVIEAETGRRPVMLLDDILSELDARYRQGVLHAAAAAEQVLITCCDAADLPEAAGASCRLFEVRDGAIV